MRAMVIGVTKAILLSTIMFTLLLSVTQAEVFVCEKDCEFTSIQSAIDSAKAGDTIVAEGPFFENLNITKSVVLTGNATLYPSGAEAGVRVSADNVKISGLNIKGGIVGMEVINARGVKIEDSSFSRNFYGIQLSGSRFCTIKGNNFQDISESAIRLERSDSNTLSFNHIDSSTVAVHLSQSSGNNLTDSSFMNVRAGVFVENSLRNNIVRNKISASDTAIFIYRSGGNRISDNSANGDIFLHLLFSSKNVVEFNEADGIIANFDSQRNDYVMENLKLTGEEFQFGFTQSTLPNDFIPLSPVLNVTIMPDVYTEKGFATFESEIPADGLDVSTVGIYRLDKGEKVSDATFEGEMLRTNFTTRQSGIYILAGKKIEKPAVAPETETPVAVSTSTPTPPPEKWIPGFQFAAAMAGIFGAMLLRKMSR